MKKKDKWHLETRNKLYLMEFIRKREMVNRNLLFLKNKLYNIVEVVCNFRTLITFFNSKQVYVSYYLIHSLILVTPSRSIFSITNSTRNFLLNLELSLLIVPQKSPCHIWYHNWSLTGDLQFPPSLLWSDKSLWSHYLLFQPFISVSV